MLLNDVRPDDVGRHQVRRELDARELQVQHVRERMHQARLADAGNALEQDVPAREQAHHRRRDDFLVPDDTAADFLRDLDEALTEQIDVLGDGSGGHWK